MLIAVIGSGNVGGTLGRRWAELGHEVVFGVRDPSRGASAVKGGSGANAPLPAGARVATPLEAVRGTGASGSADVVLLATPWPAVAQALGELGAALDGVALLDATNPIAPGLRVDAGPGGASGAERVQALAPGAHVVKVFNTTGYENMRNPELESGRAAMFYAGDDAPSKAKARDLAVALGFDAVDAGPLSRARELEHLAVLWISLAFGGTGVAALGRDFAFGVLRRDRR